MLEDRGKQVNTGYFAVRIGQLTGTLEDLLASRAAVNDFLGPLGVASSHFLAYGTSQGSWIELEGAQDVVNGSGFSLETFSSEGVQVIGCAIILDLLQAADTAQQVFGFDQGLFTRGRFLGG
jgi:hypothetical protein